MQRRRRRARAGPASAPAICSRMRVERSPAALGLVVVVERPDPVVAAREPGRVERVEHPVGELRQRRHPRRHAQRVGVRARRREAGRGEVVAAGDRVDGRDHHRDALGHVALRHQLQVGLVDDLEVGHPARVAPPQRLAEGGPRRVRAVPGVGQLVLLGHAPAPARRARRPRAGSGRASRSRRARRRGPRRSARRARRGGRSPGSPGPRAAPASAGGPASRPRSGSATSARSAAAPRAARGTRGSPRRRRASGRRTAAGRSRAPSAAARARPRASRRPVPARSASSAAPAPAIASRRVQPIPPWKQAR